MLDDLAPRVVRLENGLTAMAVLTPARQRAVVTAYFPTGSRFESARDNGISHCLEHMLFRGTPSLGSSEALATAFEDLGGTLEASTAAAHGNLAITVPRENLLRVLEPLAEVFCSPLLSELDVERGIIREEILEDFDDRGQLIDGPSLIRELAFGRHGLGQPITGPLANLEQFSAERLREHHERTHVAHGLVVCVAGDVEPARCLEALTRHFGNVSRGEPMSIEAPEEQSAPRYRLVRSRGSSQSLVHVAFRTPGHFDPADPALEMLLRVLDDGMSTRLYQRLCDKSGLCYDASSAYVSYEDAGLIEFEAETGHASTGQVLEAILTLAREVVATGVTTTELDRARRRVRWQYEAISDHPTSMADYLALAELDRTEPPAVHLGALLSATEEQILAAARRVLRADLRSVVIIGAPSGAAARSIESLALDRAS